MREIVLDVETVSTVNVVAQGVYAHAEDPTLDITMAAWAIGNEPVTLWKEVPISGTASLPPDDLAALLRDPDVLIWAHNAAYERLVIAAVWDIVVPLHRWRDSAAVARWYNLPGSLDGLSNYLLGSKAAKLKISPAVKALWATASMPWTPEDAAAFDEMGVYCVRDVEATRDCIRMLPRLPAVVWQEYAVAEAINDRGCLIDTDFVEAVVPLRAVIDDEIQHDLAQAMGSNIPDARVSPRSVAVKEWATARVATNVGGDQLLRDGQFKRAFKVRRRDGVGFYSEVKPTFDKAMRAAVRAFLEEAQDHGALDVLDLVDEGQNAAITKYAAIAKRVSADGRLRGMYIFSGAGQTHRFSSTGFQSQNILRATLDLDTDFALRRDVHTRAVEGPSALLATLPPDVREAGLGRALSMALRSTIRAAPDHDLIWCDWSAIEARVLPWLAGDHLKLQRFEQGVDVYKINARNLFRLPEDADVTKDQRQVGKVQELACVARNEMVLTDAGLVPIEQVPPCSRVWDGVEWVRHGGVVSRGIRDVIEYDGLRATADHIVFTREGLEETFGSAAARGAALCRSGTGDGHGLVVGTVAGEWLRTCEHPMPGLRGGEADLVEQSAAGAVQGLSALFPEEWRPVESAEAIGRCEEPLHQPERQGMEQLRGQGHQVPVRRGGGGGSVGVEQSWSAGTGYGLGPDRQPRPLRAGEPALGNPVREHVKHAEGGGGRGGHGLVAGEQPLQPVHDAQTASRRDDTRSDHGHGAAGGGREAEELAGDRKQTEVFDILNCGPRNRFTVSGRLVHNCGYGGGKGAFAAMSRGYGIKLPETMVSEAVKAWRSINPIIVRFWREAEKAAFAAMRESNWRKPQQAGLIRYIFAPDICFGSLLAVMPDGGMLVYPRAKIEMVERFEDQPPEAAICFDHPTFGRSSLWSGAQVEHVTQAVAASLLRDAMVRIEAAGLPITLTTHDEIVIEAHHSRSGDLEAELIKMMCHPPSWATGLPLAAEAGSGSRYKIEEAAY